MLRIATFLSIFLLSVADIGAQHTSVSTGSLDWPSWGGPNGDFTVNDAGVLRLDRRYALQVVWKKQLGTGYSAIAVRNGLAVTMFSDNTHDYVIGLDAKDGSERWKYKIGPTYLGHYGSQNGPISTPLLTDRMVIALSPRGSLFALDVDTGQKLWVVGLVVDHQAVAPFLGFTSSPVMHNNLLLVRRGGSLVEQ